MNSTVPTSADLSSEFQSLLHSGMRLAESQWRTWADLSNTTAYYQMSVDAWTHWTDLQLSLWNACWKMSSLTFEVSPMQGVEVPQPHEPHKVRLKKLAANQ